MPDKCMRIRKDGRCHYDQCPADHTLEVVEVCALGLPDEILSTAHQSVAEIADADREVAWPTKILRWYQKP